MRFSAFLTAALAVGLFSAAPAPAAKPVPAPTGANPMDPSVWEIGPITPTGNKSVGMPLNPSPDDDGWAFDFPQPDSQAGHVHYVTFKHGPLTGKTRIVLRYRIEADPGVEIYPTKYPGSPAMLTLYFQRRGDDWTAKGKYEAYRWWATFATDVRLEPGTYEMSARLDERWTAVIKSSSESNPRGFSEAVRDAERVGFTFGGGDGFGHGVFATGRARFVVTSFEILSDTDFAIREAPSSP